MTAKNNWKPWTAAEEQRLADLVTCEVSAVAIARDLERSENAIRNKALQLGITLPLYNRGRRVAARSKSGSATAIRYENSIRTQTGRG